MKHLIALLFCASLMWGQTSGVVTSGNLRSGSGSPEGSVTAPVGTMYQRTDGSTGTTLYIKESGSGNTGWVAVAPGAGGSGTFQSVITDFTPSRSTTSTTNDTLNIAAGRCKGADKSAASLQRTAGSGNGTYVAYCTDSQTVVIEYSTSAGLTTGTCTNCIKSVVTTPTIPEGMVPIASGTITSGVWDAPTDARDWTLTGYRHTNGAGMDVECSSGVCVHAVDTAQVWVQGNTLAPTGGVDMTGATTTKPFRTGTSDPGTCSVSEFLFRTDTGAVKACTVTNTWTTVGGSSGYKVMFNLPFGTYEASGGATSRLWDTNVGMTFGRTGADGACPTDSTIQTCSGLRWPSVLDSGSQTYAVATITLPSDWTSGAVTFRMAVGTSSGSFTPTFEIKTACQVSGSGLPSYNTAQTLSPALTSGQVTLASLSLTTTGCAASRPMIIQVSRSDTGSTNQYVSTSSAALEVTVP